MFEYWTTVFPGCRKPYEHAGQQFSDSFLAAALGYDHEITAAWLGHGDL